MTDVIAAFANSRLPKCILADHLEEQGHPLAKWVRSIHLVKEWYYGRPDAWWHMEVEHRSSLGQCWSSTEVYSEDAGPFEDGSYIKGGTTMIRFPTLCETAKFMRSLIVWCLEKSPA